MKRRDFLKSTAALPLSAVAGPAFFYATPAAAIEPTTVLAVVNVTSQLVSMFSRSNALSHQLAALTARLDTIIDLQMQTLDALNTISRQIDALVQAIPTELLNQTMRETLGELQGIHLSLREAERILTSAAGQDRSVIAELNEVMLEQEVGRARRICTNLAGHLATAGAPGEAGLVTVHLALSGAYAASLLVPIFKALDDELRIHGQSPRPRNASYSVIGQSLRETCSRLIAQHLTQQAQFQDSVLRRVRSEIDNDVVFRNWRSTLVISGARESSETEVKFVNHQAFGPCTRGRNFNDDRSAININRLTIIAGSMRTVTNDLPRWSNYRFEATMIIATRGAWIGERHFGLSEFSGRLASSQRTKISDFNPRDEWGPRQNHSGSEPILPMTRLQYFCPGTASGDRNTWSQILLDEHYVPFLRDKLTGYAQLLLGETMREVILHALNEGLEWCNATIGRLDETDLVLRS